MSVLPLASLRSRLFVVVVAAITPFVLYAALSAARGRSVAGASLRTQSLARAQATARSLDDRLQAVDQLLDSAMARVRQPGERVRDLPFTSPGVDPLAGALTIALLDTTGTRTAVLLGSAARVDAIPLPRRTTVVAAAFGGATNKRGKNVAGTFVDEGALRNEGDSIAMIIVRPIVRSRARCNCPADVPGALVAVLSDRAVQTLLGSDTIADGGIAVLTSSSGSPLGRPLVASRWTEREARDPSVVAAGVQREGVLELTGQDDVTRAFGFAALKRLPWRVYVGIPTTNMSAVPDQQLRDALMLAVLALAIASVGVVVASRAFSGPLQTLVADTKRLSAGALSHRTEVAESPGELGALGLALNTMAADLEARRKAVQEELRRATIVFDASPVAMWVADADAGSTSTGRIQQANTAAARLFGVPAGALIGQRDVELLDAAGAALLGSPAAGDDESAPSTRTGRATVRDAAGAARDMQLHVTVVPNLRQPMRIVTALELPTAATATQITSGEQPGQASVAGAPSDQASEAALVAFAAHVAADFSEVLQGMAGFTQLALESADDPDMRSIAMERISDLTARGLGIARQVRAFGQRDQLQPELLDANVILTESAQAMAETLGRDVELDILYNVTPATVVADAQLLSQVVTTLIANARDAMPAGGTLTLATTLVEVPHAAGGTYAAPPGHYIVLTVADTGMGMSADARAHMFEPFWSTKRQQGRGTGLGLAAAAGIARQHGWSIGVDTELEVGTAISVYMPLAEDLLPDQSADDDQPSFETMPARSA